MPKKSRAMAEALFAVLGNCDEIKGNEYNFSCPFCEDGTSAGHLHVNFHKQKAICHRCGYGAGNLVKVFHDLNIDEPEVYVTAVTKDTKTFLDDLWQKDAKEKQVEKVELPEGYTVLSVNSKCPVSKMFLGYLKYCRGMSDSEISSIPIGYTLDGEFSGRLIFPVYMYGKLVYFTSRAVLAGAPKSKHPKIDRRYILYGLDWLVSSEHVFLVEGIFDTMAFRNQSLAVFSHYIRDEQAEILRRLNPKEVTVCFDSDVSLSLIYQICKRLSQQLESTISFIELEDGDPYDYRHRIDYYISRRIVYDTHRALRNHLHNALEDSATKRKNRLTRGSI